MYEKHIQYLRHILDECDYIVTTMKEVTSFKALIEDEDKKRGIVRSLDYQNKEGYPHSIFLTQTIITNTGRRH